MHQVAATEKILPFCVRDCSGDLCPVLRLQMNRRADDDFLLRVAYHSLQSPSLGDVLGLGVS